MIDLPLKRRKIIRNRKDRLRKRVPELGSRGKEAVVVTIEPRVDYFHRISVGIGGLAGVARPWKRRWHTTRQLN